MNRKTGTDAGDRKDENKKVNRQAGAGRPLLHGCISVSARTAVDHREENKAKECDGEFHLSQHDRMCVTSWMHATSQEKNRRSFDRDAGQSSRSPRTSIDVDSVAPDIRMRHRRVTVHNESFVVSRRVEELVANPDQIVEILSLDRDVRTNAGVNEQEIAAAELIAQALHEQFVCTRKGVEKAAMQIDGGLGSSCSSMP